MKTFEVEVIQFIRVTVDETKFTPAFYEEFALESGPITNIGGHILNLAVLRAEGVIHNGGTCFGYGSLDEMGIHFDSLGCNLVGTTLVDPAPEPGA